MSGCVNPKTIIERLRKGNSFTDEELSSLCVVSLCDKLRAELRPEDLRMVKRILQSENTHEACIGQVLVRPFLYEDGMKEFLIELWKNTNHEYLKAGLLLDLFEYEDIDNRFIEEAFKFIEDNREIVLRMLNEWLEGEDKIVPTIQKKLKGGKLTSRKTILYKQILYLTSTVYPMV
ncbi:MAG: hypothetical protein AB1480_14660 [Nitrospirota bacterium]